MLFIYIYRNFGAVYSASCNLCAHVMAWVFSNICIPAKVKSSLSLLQSSKNKLKHRLIRSISSACLVWLEPIITKMKITHTSVITFFIKYIIISFFLYIPISFIIVLARISGFVSCQMIHEIRCGKYVWIGGEEMREEKGWRFNSPFDIVISCPRK